MKGPWYLWLLVLAVFGFAGYIIWQNTSNKPLPDALGFVDVNSYSDQKRIVCPYEFITIEFSDGTNEQCNSIKIANFSAVDNCFHDSNFVLYTNPVKQRVDWVGKTPPTEAQLRIHPQVQTLFPNVKVLKAVNIERQKGECRYKVPTAPEERVDPRSVLDQNIDELLKMETE